MAKRYEIKEALDFRFCQRQSCTFTILHRSVKSILILMILTTVLQDGQPETDHGVEWPPICSL